MKQAMIPEAPAVLIDRLDDPRLEVYADLKRPRQMSERFIVEGRLPVRRLLASDHEVDSVLVARGCEGELAADIRSPTALLTMPADLLKQLVGFDFHRGFLACGRRRPFLTADQLPAHCGLAIAMIGLSEQENVGSVLRSAAAFGVSHVLVGPRTIDPFARRVIRVSMANSLQMKYYTLNDPERQFDQWAERQPLRTVATTLDPTAPSLDDYVADQRPTVLLLGNEADGLDPTLVASATDRIRIPMRSGVDSLNVAVAAAICLYAMTSR